MAMAQDYDQAEIYRDLRAQALAVSADQVAPLDGALAVLMETGYPEAVASLVAVADGTTSLYFSTGGGIIGAGEYPQVSAEARALLELANGNRAALGRVAAFPLPQEGHTRFYLVTEAGVFGAEAPESDLGNEMHDLSPVFLQGHKLIAYVRAADEHRRSAAGDNESE